MGLFPSCGGVSGVPFPVLGDPPFSAEKADIAVEEGNRSIRVDGNCGCPDPDTYGGNFISLYHVGTPAGLKLLVDAIRPLA